MSWMTYCFAPIRRMNTGQFWISTMRRRSDALDWSMYL